MKKCNLYKRFQTNLFFFLILKSYHLKSCLQGAFITDKDPKHDAFVFHSLCFSPNSSIWTALLSLGQIVRVLIPIRFTCSMS